ncbi:hypothetical protein J6W34_04670 [bacterium]|nr:hypothetical protein [bacterium]
MTENEIIEYLKGNKNKGAAFGFMPDEVQKWCDNNKTKLKFFDGFDNLRGWKDYNNSNADIHFVDILCLPEDFKMEEKSKGEWVEFEIDKNGQFTIEFCKGSLVYCYDWFNWWKLLEKSKEYDYGFTAFGGWLYDKTGDWVLSPQVGLIDDSRRAPFILNRYSYSYKKERIIPVIPIKIRFWRK